MIRKDKDLKTENTLFGRLFLFENCQNIFKITRENVKRIIIPDIELKIGAALHKRIIKGGFSLIIIWPGWPRNTLII